jgi:poly-beta-1,6-N-acetyl-D-glucosamine synthase
MIFSFIVLPTADALGGKLGFYFQNLIRSFEVVYVVFAVLALHIVCVIALLYGFQKALVVQEEPQAARVAQMISVIIPFRNETKNLPALIESLTRQQHKPVEFLLVDDASDDGSLVLAENLCRGNSAFRILTSIGAGKKNALTTGVMASSGTLIVTTDADCVHSTEWLNLVHDQFSGDTELAIGPVAIDGKEKTLFNRLQQIEFAGVVATGIGAYGLGKPIYCNGANLAFTKKAFERVDGYSGNEHVASGDDEFLLKKIASANTHRVKLLKGRGSIVSTQPAVSLQEFLAQRLRWASKWTSSPGIVSKIGAIFIVMVQLAFLAAIVLTLSNGIPALTYLLGAKMITEFIFVFSATHYFKIPLSFFGFIVLQLLYPFYVLYVGLGTNFHRTSWKGRRI